MLHLKWPCAFSKCIFFSWCRSYCKCVYCSDTGPKPTVTNDPPPTVCRAESVPPPILNDITALRYRLQIPGTLFVWGIMCFDLWLLKRGKLKKGAGKGKNRPWKHFQKKYGHAFKTGEQDRSFCLSFQQISSVLTGLPMFYYGAREAASLWELSASSWPGIEC